MTKYLMQVWEEQGGYLPIEANSKAEAEKKAEEYLNEFGFNDSVNTTHRNTEIHGVEEQGND